MEVDIWLLCGKIFPISIINILLVGIKGQFIVTLSGYLLTARRIRVLSAKANFVCAETPVLALLSVGGLVEILLLGAVLVHLPLEVVEELVLARVVAGGSQVFDVGVVDVEAAGVRDGSAEDEESGGDLSARRRKWVSFAVAKSGTVKEVLS